MAKVRTPGCAGYLTSSSVPGGLFGSAPDPQQRHRLDGRAGGRGNSSSVVGGVFGDMNPPQPAGSNPFNPSLGSSVSGGIFGGGEWAVEASGGETPQRPLQGSRPFNPSLGSSVSGGIFGGGEWAAEASGGHGVGRGPHALPPHQQRQRTGADFMSRLDEAVHRDDEHAEYMLELEAQQMAAYEEYDEYDEEYDEEQEEGALDDDTIAAAAEQIAVEQGLSPEQHEALLAQMKARLLQPPMAQPAASSRLRSSISWKRRCRT